MWKLFMLLPIVWVITSTSFHSSAVGKIAGSCNKTGLDTKTGSFNLNNSAFAHSLFCFWEVESNNSTKKNSTGPIALLFHQLFLDAGDEVMVYKRLDNVSAEPLDPILDTPIKAQNGSVIVVTGDGKTVVTLKGTNPNLIREFDVMFAHECRFAVPPEVEILHIPILANNVQNDSEECILNFNKIAHKRVHQVFTFLEYNMEQGSVKIDHASIDKYTNSQPTDFFITDEHSSDPVMLTVDIKRNSTDSFTLKIEEVDRECSGLKMISTDQITILSSPSEVLNNGSITTNCRWVIQHNNAKKILGLTFDTLNFQSVFDIVAVNDGLSEVSSPLMQVTTSNRNETRNQVIRSSGSYLWVSFKPVSYASQLKFNVTVHGQGGHFVNSGQFSMSSTVGDDTAFLLEVPENEIVMLSFVDSAFAPPATISIYNDFDNTTLLTTIRQTVKYPVLSRGSRMMVVGTNFSSKANHFTANFKGISPSCNHMSTLSTENYILTEGCNTTCTWVISPQETKDSEWIIYFQYISLNPGDTLEIHKLDADLTSLGVVTSNMTHVPHISVPVDVGALVKVTQADCKVKSDKVKLIGHASIIPDCNQNIVLKSLDSIQISSPLYPDTYPLFSSCQWNITVPVGTFVHLAFENLKLTENHCIKVSDKSKHIEFDGETKPDDLFFSSGDVLVQFDSSHCGKKEVGQSLAADTGFLLNVTVADCGEIFKGKSSGDFNTGIPVNKSLCIWKVDVSDKSVVNTISYTMHKRDQLKNYELSVFDGASVRDSKILNDTGLEIWSRSSQLIFIYRRLNASQPSSIIDFKFKTITCNSTMLCDNKVCLHPDWRCNGNNDCGDFTDERDCEAPPVQPPQNIFTGYSSTAFWLCIFAMLLLGVILGLTAPVCYQKYRDSRYARFRELSGIDG